jgi:hypothetical protein
VNAVWEVAADGLRYCQSQPCLADATGPAQCQQADVVTVQKSARLSDLTLPPDEWGGKGLQA